MARDGMAAVSPENIAAECGLTAGKINECFQTMNDVLLALAADELSALARRTGGADESLALLKMAEAIIDPRGAEAPRNGETAVESPVQPARPPLLRRRPDPEVGEATGAAAGDIMPARKPVVMSDELNGILNELVSHESASEGGTANAIVRLERRIFVIERMLAEHGEQNQPPQIAPQASVPPGESVSDISKRLAALEKRVTDFGGEFRAGMKEAASRLAILEATPPAGASGGATPPPAAPEIDEAVLLSPPTRISDDSSDGSGGSDSGGEASEDEQSRER